MIENETVAVVGFVDALGALTIIGPTLNEDSDTFNLRCDVLRAGNFLRGVEPDGPHIRRADPGTVSSGAGAY